MSKARYVGLLTILSLSFLAGSKRDSFADEDRQRMRSEVDAGSTPLVSVESFGCTVARRVEFMVDGSPSRSPGCGYPRFRVQLFRDGRFVYTQTKKGFDEFSREGNVDREEVSMFVKELADADFPDVQSSDTSDLEGGSVDLEIQGLVNDIDHKVRIKTSVHEGGCLPEMLRFVSTFITRLNLRDDICEGYMGECIPAAALQPPYRDLF